VRTVLSHTYLPGIRNRITWERRAASTLMRFGRWVFVSTLLTFLVGPADRLVFGRLVPLERLGVYYIGMVIATIPSEALGRLSMQILLPVFSRVRERDGHFRDSFESVRAPLAALSAWACAGLVAGGPTAIDLLYDDRYQEAGWAVQLLAVSGFFLVMGTTYGAALLAADRPRSLAAGSLAKLVLMSILIPLGFHMGEARQVGLGFPVAVLGYALSEVARYVVCWRACRSLGVSGSRGDFKSMLLVAVVGGLGGVLEAWMRHLELNVLLRAAVITVVVSLGFLPLAGPLLRERLSRRGPHSAAQITE
jgi:O-antigen/teichoic acid export membrane protein